MKKRSKIIFTLLIGSVLLTGCDYFSNAGDYANKIDFDKEHQAFKVRDIVGTLDFEGTGGDVEVFFVPEDGERVSFESEEVIELAYEGSVAFENMKFDGTDDEARIASVSAFNERNGKLYFLTVQSEFGIDDPYPTYYYEEKEVLLGVAHGLEVYDFDQAMFEKYGDKADYKGIKEGYYSTVYFDTSDEGSRGDDIEGFIFEEASELGSVSQVRTYINSDEDSPSFGDELVDANGKPLIDVIVNLEGEDISLRYNQSFDNSQTAIDAMVSYFADRGRNNVGLITYRYFDILDAEGNVLVAKPLIANFTYEDEVLAYNDGENVIEINQEEITYEIISNHPDIAEDANTTIAINPVISIADAYAGNDQFLSEGEYAGIHLYATTSAE